MLQFEFRDVNTAKRFWWLVIKRDEVDVCMKRPGYDVDVTITTRLKTFATTARALDERQTCTEYQLAAP